VKISGLRTMVAGTGWRNLVFLEVTTDEGLSGIGEATVEYREDAVVAQLGLAAERVRGLDPTNQSLLWRTLVTSDFMSGDVVGQGAAAGILTACLDISAQALGVPLHRLLGGAFRERVPVYANGWYRGERTAQSFGLLACKAVAAGHRALKVDPFGTAAALATSAQLREATELLAAIREAVGPEVEIYVDAHGRLTPARAREAAALFAEVGIGFLEEPVHPRDLRALRDLRGSAGVAIAGGERSIGRWGFRELIEGDCVDIVQPDGVWCGGPLEALRIAFMAELHHMLVAPHNANSPLSTAVACHVAAVTPNLLRLESFDDFDEAWVREAVVGAPRVEDGCLAVSQVPGIGVHLNEEVLREHPPRQVFVDFEQEGWEMRQADVDHGQG
jgi:galactonate dehydratase